MYLLSESNPTRASILQAGLELLVERGYKGATTRAIAERAGLTEVTLFRHFESKEALLKAAVAQFSPPLAEVVPPDSGDLETDLLELGQNYLDLIQRQGGLILRLVPELLRHPELVGEGPPPGVMQVFGAVTGFFARQQAAGRLHRAESPEQLALGFAGPLFARMMLGGIWHLGLEFDLKAHVRGFLEGRRGNG
ncbi:MAG: TetR family transcriptional regulator [Meiothermus sp.]